MYSAHRFSKNLLCLFAFLISCPAFSQGIEPGEVDHKARLREGRDLFLHKWATCDARSFDGDGLGPVFNGRSCIDCHYQGGYGGYGPWDSNTTIVSAGVYSSLARPRSKLPGATLISELNLKQADRRLLARIHPTLETENSFPLHKFSEDANFHTWKLETFSGRDQFTEITTMVGNVQVTLQASMRNTPALLGAGLIDRIPDSVLEAVAAEQSHTSPGTPNSKIIPSTVGINVIPRPRQPLPVAGRVARLKDGSVGRFGWKSNVATLREFTLQECSAELGLEVPGFPRAAPPWNKDYIAPGLDLSPAQSDCLTEYVALLPRPITRAPETPQQRADFAAGEKVFTSIGCAQCHRPKLGDVDGIYSDLLLHDMGWSSCAGGYYRAYYELVQWPGSTAALPIARYKNEATDRDKPPQFGAGACEWRTPPLWGVRDSGPYLHDGRAGTIADAILAHDGEGAAAARDYEELRSHKRRQIDYFLGSLVAPPMHW